MGRVTRGVDLIARADGGSDGDEAYAVDADEPQDVAQVGRRHIDAAPGDVEADVCAVAPVRTSRRGATGLGHLTLRLPNVGCTSGIGGICQVPVIGMPVSRLIITSITVGTFDRIASR